MKKLLFCLLFLTGCNNGFKATPPASIDPQIRPYYEQYRTDKKAYLGTDQVRKIDIYFTDLSRTIFDALCWKTKEGHRFIQVDYNRWQKSTDYDKITTIYHELGHCDLDLLHSNTPTIMNPNGLLGNVFATDRNYYLTELFKEGI